MRFILLVYLILGGNPKWKSAGKFWYEIQLSTPDNSKLLGKSEKVKLAGV